MKADKLTIVAALRVRNEGRWIREVLTAIKWCAGIYLMDDHSTDDTPSIASECGAHVLPTPFGMDMDQARDKEWLISRIAAEYPIGTWILMIDGDEELEADGESIIRRTLRTSPRGPAFSLQIRYLWNDINQVRMDGVYGHFKRPSLFHLPKDYSFRRSGIPGNHHVSCVPKAYLGSVQRCEAILWHYGYLHKEDRIRKWKFLNAKDGRNIREGYDPRHPERGSYPHIVQGDVPQVSAGAILRHGGPLRLEARFAANA